MIDRRCLYCDYYDADFECTLPSYHEYACILHQDKLNTKDCEEGEK